MIHTVTFKAHGHPNIRSRHKTTLMTTVEPHLTTRGDCIIGVSADIGLAQLSLEIKEAARDPETIITFTLITDSFQFIAKGRGHPELSYNDPIDMVARKSSYTCRRTLMIHSDKAAIDLPKDIMKELQNPETEITIKLTYETKKK
jgi:hypothetical protein